MLRLLMLGVLIYGLGVGLQRDWVRVRWSQMVYDLGVPGASPPPPDPADCSSARQAASPSR